MSITNLQVAREKQGLTIETLSEMSGISKRKLIKLENNFYGLLRMKTRTFAKLSTVLNCSSDKLKERYLTRNFNY